jgi:fermentation-respiration switch protein FrsA (DUF1100 family)
MLLLLENYLVYHPVKAGSEWLPPLNAHVQDVDLLSSDGTKLHAWWFPHDDDEGTVLYCHGNAGNLSHRREMFMAWHQQMKMSVLIFDYPGYGKSDGNPSEAGCYEAGEAAYQWLTKSAGVAPESILLYGGSLGGGVAVDLASRHPCRALVLVAAFTSVPDLAQKLYPWLPARWLVRHRFDNLEKIARSAYPVFIAHGDRDSLIPISQSERLYAAANEPKRFFVLEGHEHHEGPDPAFFAALRQFLESTGPK